MFCDNLEGWERVGGGREIQEGVDIHLPMADSRRRQWHPTPVFLPGESYGQRTLVGYSPWGHKKSDMT